MAHKAATRATVVIAIATVINLIVSALLFIAAKGSTDVARATYSAANRPYVGLDHVETFSGEGGFRWVGYVNNFGSVPAEEVDLSVLPEVNGAVLPAIGFVGELLPSTIFQNTPVRRTGSLNSETWKQISDGSASFEITISAKYRGLSGESYAYCERLRYLPPVRGFQDLGRCP